MKIESEQLLASVYRFKTETPVKGDASPESGSAGVGQSSDRVELSRSNSKMEQLKTMMKQMPDSQQNKLAQIKQQIADGSYQVAASETAGKMLDHWRALRAN
jgi:negative regulator of flagellin synthesis FlgM